jgi:hypothetical protein
MSQVSPPAGGLVVWVTELAIGRCPMLLPDTHFGALNNKLIVTFRNFISQTLKTKTIVF